MELKDSFTKIKEGYSYFSKNMWKQTFFRLDKNKNET